MAIIKSILIITAIVFFVCGIISCTGLGGFGFCYDSGSIVAGVSGAVLMIGGVIILCMVIIIDLLTKFLNKKTG